MSCGRARRSMGRPTLRHPKRRIRPEAQKRALCLACIEYRLPTLVVRPHAFISQCYRSYQTFDMVSSVPCSATLSWWKTSGTSPAWSGIARGLSFASNSLRLDSAITQRRRSRNWVRHDHRQQRYFGFHAQSVCSEPLSPDQGDRRSSRHELSHGACAPDARAQQAGSASREILAAHVASQNDIHHVMSIKPGTEQILNATHGAQESTTIIEHVSGVPGITA